MKWQSFFVWTVIFVVVAASGVLYSWVFYGGFMQGGIYAVVVCVPIIAFERGLFFRELRRWIVALPSWGYLMAQLAFYIGVILAGFFIAGTAMWYFEIVNGPWREAAIPHFVALIYRILVALIIIAILRVRDLLGQKRFINLILGRYRTPTIEERIFLIVDLTGSTQYAEKFGDLKLMALLSALFSAIGDPVRRKGGAIDDYVGDAVIISWPMDAGLERARCVRCVFEIFETVLDDAQLWNSQFGQVPELRAALHGGEVVTAEVGSDHHKITYFGDTINIAARMEQMCKELGEKILISKSLAERMRMPKNVEVRECGFQAIRGKQAAIEICALHQHQSSRSSTARSFHHAVGEAKTVRTGR